VSCPSASVLVRRASARISRPGSGRPRASPSRGPSRSTGSGRADATPTSADPASPHFTSHAPRGRQEHTLGVRALPPSPGRRQHPTVRQRELLPSRTRRDSGRNTRWPTVRSCRRQDSRRSPQCVNVSSWRREPAGTAAGTHTGRPCAPAVARTAEEAHNASKWAPPVENPQGQRQEHTLADRALLPSPRQQRESTVRQRELLPSWIRRLAHTLTASVDPDGGVTTVRTHGGVTCALLPSLDTSPGTRRREARAAASPRRQPGDTESVGACPAGAYRAGEGWRTPLRTASGVRVRSASRTSAGEIRCRKVPEVRLAAPPGAPAQEALQRWVASATPASSRTAAVLVSEPLTRRAKTSRRPPVAVT
jgi:hypothetical protein